MILIGDIAQDMLITYFHVCIGQTPSFGILKKLCGEYPVIGLCS